MDPYTLMIEAVGVAILLIWMIVPAREFAEIFRRLRLKRAKPEAAHANPVDREGRPS